MEKLLTRFRKQKNEQDIGESDNDSKTTWKIIREVTDQLRKSKKEVNPFNENLKERANSLNQFFINSAAVLIGNQVQIRIHFDNIPSYGVNLKFEITKGEEIEEIVKSFKNKKSSEDDEMSPFHIKQVIKSISKALVLIIIGFLKYRVFPELLKLSIVSPLPIRRHKFERKF